MAGPTTEVLNDDIKELRREMHEGFDALRNDFVKVAVDLAELRGELKVTFNIMKWAGALLVTTILTSGAAGLWWASGINSKVDGLSKNMDERFKASDSRLDDRFKAIDARFDRLESLVIKAIDRGQPAVESKKSEAGANAPAK